MILNFANHSPFNTFCIHLFHNQILNHLNEFKIFKSRITWTTNANIQKIFVPTSHNCGIKRAKVGLIEFFLNQWNCIRCCMWHPNQMALPTRLGIPRDHGFDSIKTWRIHGKFGCNKSKWPNGKKCCWVLIFVEEWMAYKD